MFLFLFRYTPLLAAASSSERTNNHVVVCELLIRRGAKPNLITDAGTSLLHYLVRFPPCPDLTILLNLLIENGTDIDIRDANEETPLLQAAFRGNETTIEFLIQNGAGLDNTNKIGSFSLSLSFSFSYSFSFFLSLSLKFIFFLLFIFYS